MTLTAPPPAAELTNGLFGKLPNHADFLRVNVTGAGLEFAAYLEGAVDVCRRVGCEVAIPEAYFLYSAPGSSTALLGLLQPSADTVGRVFPVAVFTEIEVESAAGNFDILPLAFLPFFAAATTLVQDGASLASDDLAPRLEALPFPTVSEFEAAQARGDALLLETPIAAFGATPFGGGAQGQQYLAFSTLAAACEQSRQAVSDTKLGLTLELPLVDPDDVVLWLAIVRRLLGEQSVCPNVMWTPPRSSPSCGSVKVDVPPTPGRLCVSFGAPSPSVVAFLAGALRDSPRLWPVAAVDAAALDGVKASLSSEQLALLGDPHATLEAAVVVFGG
jgi:type VI secretion system protein ImpM